MVKLQKQEREQDGYTKRQFTVTVPARLVIAMGWRKGDDLEFKYGQGGLVLRKK